MSNKRIHLTKEDHQKLTAILTSMKRKGTLRSPHLRTLLHELGVAVIIGEGETPDGIVCMGSKVTYRNGETGSVDTAILVFPADADAEQYKISVLAPLGAALIGETTGTQSHCQAPDSTWSVDILSVEAPVVV